jgi:hypothetical protein
VAKELSCRTYRGNYQGSNLTAGTTIFYSKAPVPGKKGKQNTHRLHFKNIYNVFIKAAKST